MSRRPRIVLALAVLAEASSCVALNSEPWTRFRAGAATMELSTGVTEQNMNVSLEGESGALGPFDASQSVELESEYLIGARGQSFVTDAWSIGGGLEWWRQKSAKADFDEFDMRSDPFGYLRYLVSSRYMFRPLGPGRFQRVRPFLGGDFFYVSDLDVDLSFDYPNGPSATEDVKFEGHGFYGYSLGAGIAVLASDDTLLEVGGRWSQNFSESDDSILLHPPAGQPSQMDVSLDPEGWSLYVSLTYSF
jgi:hypothetical protein